MGEKEEKKRRKSSSIDFRKASVKKGGELIKNGGANSNFEIGPSRVFSKLDCFWRKASWAATSSPFFL